MPRHKASIDALRMPPHSEEAEQSVLGSLMLDKNAITKIADILKADDFYRDVHSMIYEAMVELYETSEPIDVLSVANRLEEKGKIEEKNAIIFGNEGHGVSQELLDIANEQLIIPIYGKAESLNVSIAAGIFLYKYRELKSL